MTSAALWITLRHFGVQAAQRIMACTTVQRHRKLLTFITRSNSLWLIRPDDVILRVLAPGANFGNPKRAVRAEFRYQGTHYNFKIMDLTAERAFLSRPNGDYPLEQNAYSCVSFAEAHTDGYCYKLVATVITERPL